MAYGNPLADDIRVLAVKSETTVGTAISLAAANAACVTHDQMMNYRNPVAERLAMGALGTAYNVPEGFWFEPTFKTFLQGGSSPVMSAFHSTMWGACGLDALTTPGTATTTDDQTKWKPATMGLYKNGRAEIAACCMFNAVLEFQSGKPALVTFSGFGGFSSNADAAMPTGITYPTPLPPVWGGAAYFTLDSSIIFPVSKVTIDLGNNPFIREDANSGGRTGGGGYLGGWIMNRKLKVTMDPEARLRATTDWDAICKAGTEKAMTIVLGSTAGNITTITMSNLQLANQPTPGNRNGMIVDNLTFYGNQNSFSLVNS